MVKAIVLDMGGVLVNLDTSLCMNAYKERVGIEHPEYLVDPCHPKGALYELEAGRIELDEFFTRVKGFSRPGTTDEDIQACQCEMIREIDPVKAEYLKELRTRFPLYILSNNNPLVMPRCMERFREAGIPADSLFVEMFLSCEMKMMKPGKEIYLEAIKRIGLEPSELLFIDDSMLNVEAARSVGMNAAYYERGTDLRALIESELWVMWT